MSNASHATMSVTAITTHQAQDARHFCSAPPRAFGAMAKKSGRADKSFTKLIGFLNRLLARQDLSGATHLQVIEALIEVKRAREMAVNDIRTADEYDKQGEIGGPGGGGDGPGLALVAAGGPGGGGGFLAAPAAGPPPPPHRRHRRQRHTQRSAAAGAGAGAALR